LFLQIRVADEKLVVVLEDNGANFAPAVARSERNGLRNMEERLSDIGGVCRVTATPTKGCRVIFNLPLRPPTLAKNPLASLFGKVFQRKRPHDFA
jgi:signal transduction histidine kinase